MSQPLVSVITPSFNRAGFIEGTIRSIAGQTYRHIEHIVIDGGSTDRTVDILEVHARAGALYYLSEPDKGMYDAINKGLSRARGDILCYLNTDDRYFPWSVETAVQYLAANPQADIIYGDTLVHDIGRNRQSLNFLPSFRSTWLRSGGIIPQPTVFFRRRVYEVIGSFQREVKYLADCEYWLRADRAGMHIAKLHEFLAVETNHPETIRQSLAEEVNKEKQRLLKLYSPWPPGFSLMNVLIRRVKYIEKESLVMLFAMSNAMSTVRKSGWNQFRSAYSINMKAWRYYIDKFLRSDRLHWTICGK